jgi:hypothetical protein
VKTAVVAAFGRSGDSTPDPESAAVPAFAPASVAFTAAPFDFVAGFASAAAPPAAGANTADVAARGTGGGTPFVFVPGFASSAASDSPGAADDSFGNRGS